MFFTNMLQDGEYCGTSYVDNPLNAWCFDHCDFRPWGGNPPAVESGYSPSGGSSIDTDNRPEESSPETSAPETEDDRDIFTDDDFGDGFNWEEFFE